MKKHFILLLLIGLILTSGCSSDNSSSNPPEPINNASNENINSQNENPNPPTEDNSTFEITEHVIGIRQGNNGAEFYNKLTNQTFVPIGSNLIQFKPPEGDLTFTVGDYDHNWMEEQLTEMENFGFNTLRVFMDLCNERCIANSQGLQDEFIDNIVDFLWLAKEHNIFVIITSNDLVDDSPYARSLPCCDPFGGYRGSYYLSAKGVKAWQDYFSDVITSLIEKRAPTEIILAYQINNEQFFLSDVPPLSLQEGSVTTANGETYNMALPEEKRRMVEDGLIYFGDEVRAAILEVDPTALVTIGFFPPDEPHIIRADNRLVLTERFIRESSLDFYDLHPYDWGNTTLTQEVENFGILDGYNDKPLLMGEFGAFTYLYKTPEEGAQAIVNWQTESCKYGFDGWLYWLWGVRDFNEEVWTGSQGSNAINNALSPLNRPDPCDAGEYAYAINLASDAHLRASSTLAENPLELAVDGLNNTFWGAGASPPQWIELNLNSPATITEIRLLVSQYPSGETFHRVRGQTSTGEWIALTELSGNTNDGDWLEVVFETPFENIQIIRIETTRSPSWVSWYEIQVLGEFTN